MRGDRAGQECQTLNTSEQKPSLLTPTHGFARTHETETKKVSRLGRITMNHSQPPRYIYIYIFVVYA